MIDSELQRRSYCQWHFSKFLMNAANLLFLIKHAILNRLFILVPLENVFMSNGTVAGNVRQHFVGCVYI